MNRWLREGPEPCGYYAEYSGRLADAGFGPVEVLPLDAAGANTALVARKPD
ncbi:hypothetical protein OG818_32965 [Streptomyces virginiae]|uniref:hypothetical protein n=1 Tax=Streptomyces virginiae TaxID=1961 RepID=UPI0022566D51|nr:hypothetical protein [Streptomyces virginiae]MCX4720535.1 hypothetical protein [Streptomyces virginiae]